MQQKEPSKIQKDFIVGWIGQGKATNHMAAALGVHYTVAKRWRTAVEQEMIALLDSKSSKSEVSPAAPKVVGNDPRPALNGAWLNASHLKIGIISDTHIGSKFCREDILNYAYRQFEVEEVEFVVHAGNIVDGHSTRINEYEITVHGIGPQIEYAAASYPRIGVPTYFVSAPDHEGWWDRDSGLGFGRRFSDHCHAIGRSDLHHLGYLEGDIKVGNTVLRVLHPSGAAAQAHSWVAQRIIGNYQADEKPGMLVVGHHHKMNTGRHNDVWFAMAGCCQEQTAFMRSKGVPAHLGFYIADIYLDSNGLISRVRWDHHGFNTRRYYPRKAINA